MIFVALGANLPSRFGEPRATLAAARAAMAKAGLNLVAQSSTWLTAPVPVSDQPWYHNEVVAIETTHDAPALLRVLQGIENDFGRVRTVRNAPRVLDLDIIAYNDQVLALPGLMVPHPRMDQRAFVLLPMREIAPAGWVHPVSGLSLDEMIRALPAGQEAQAIRAAETGTGS